MSTHARLCLVLPIIASTRVQSQMGISGILPGCDGVAQGPRSECWSVAVHFLPPRGAVWGVHRDVFRVYQGSTSAYPTPVCETSRTRTQACGIPSSQWCSANGDPVSSGCSSCVEVLSIVGVVVVVVVVTMLLSQFLALENVLMDGLFMTMRSMIASSARGMLLHGEA